MGAMQSFWLTVECLRRLYNEQFKTQAEEDAEARDLETNPSP